MQNFGKLLMAGVLATAFGIPGAMAATNGTLGATSTGTANVSLSISQQYRVSGLTDFAFGTYGGTGDLVDDNDLCVYTNNAAGTYKVSFTDSSTMSTTGFSVQNGGATAQIPYAVAWNDQTTTAGGVAATYATLLPSTGANVISSDCSTGGNSANLQLTLGASALQAAPAGSYATTLSVRIEP